jgi:nucleotide-binding universal stress UspA family protein
VAMTTHGRTGFARLMHGSVAQHVFIHVDVPVLLYRGSTEEGWEGVLGQ